MDYWGNIKGTTYLKRQASLLTLGINCSSNFWNECRFLSFHINLTYRFARRLSNIDNLNNFVSLDIFVQDEETVLVFEVQRMT
jgi:hypothetical protein